MTCKNKNHRHSSLVLISIVHFSLLMFATITNNALAADSYFFDKGHTEIRFYYGHGGLSTQSGEFTDFEGTLLLDTNFLSNTAASMTIQANSVTTGVKNLDSVITGPSFFSTKNHPTITFESTMFVRGGEPGYTIEGNLTIRGVTKPIKLEAKILHKGANKVGLILPAYQGEWVGIKATTSFLRSDFGIDSYVPMVSDRIRVEVNAELKKQPNQ